MTNSIHERVLQTISRHDMIRPGDRVGLGVSGGADSTAMLRIFADLRNQLGITLFVLHFHHQLRGADADEDEQFVQALAAKLGMPCEKGRADVAGEARRHGWNLEDAARRLRYEFFESVAAARGLNRVAAAHTVDDQAETVLSRLLRGTGMTGLAGIYPVAGLIIRPLLDLRREELRDFLNELNQPWREDSTNQDTARTRAHIRHDLIPFLHNEFGTSVVTRLARLAAHAREDETFWSALEDERLSALATRNSSQEISMDITDLFSPLPAVGSARRGDSHGSISTEPVLALSRRLVRRIYSELRGAREQLTAHHVESVLRLAAKSQSGARLELPGMIVEKVFGRLSFRNLSAEAGHSRQSRLPTNAPEFTYKVPQVDTGQPASVVVSEIHRRFSLKVVDWPAVASETETGWGALDFDSIRWPIFLRNWRPGDCYRPFGSQRARKLKQLFLKSRVPRNARESWPVLTSEDRVIWAPGFPVAAELAPNRKTQRGLVIREEEI